MSPDQAMDLVSGIQDEIPEATTSAGEGEGRAGTKFGLLCGPYQIPIDSDLKATWLRASFESSNPIMASGLVRA